MARHGNRSSVLNNMEVVREYFERLDPKFLGLGGRPKVERVLPLELGEAHLNFLVQAGGRKFIFRVNMDQSSRGKSRKEFEMLNLLGDYKVAPRTFYLDESREVFDETLLIVEYVDGRPLSAVETKTVPADAVAKLAELLARVHSLDLGKSLDLLPRRGVSYGNWVRVNRRNVDYVRRRGSERLYGDDLLDRVLDDGLSKIVSIAKQAKYPNAVTPAHGDVCAQNVLVDQASGDLRLIDWESFGLWDPAAEIALVLEGFGLDLLSSQQEEFLRRYRSLRKDDTLLDRLDVFRPLVRFEQLTWGIKHAFEIMAGELNPAFVKRTDMQKHLAFVSLFLRRCSETNLIDVKPGEVKGLEEILGSCARSAMAGDRVDIYR